MPPTDQQRMLTAKQQLLSSSIGQPKSRSFVSASSTVSSQSLLMLTKIFVKLLDESIKVATAFLDSGAQRNYRNVTSEFAKRIGLKPSHHGFQIKPRQRITARTDNPAKQNFRIFKSIN
jgi:hypothetical protein